MADISAQKLVCNDIAEVISQYLPNKTPAAYLYENADGLRFFVLAFDHYASRYNADYHNNYYRQEQLIKGLEWVGRAKLPAVSLKNPYLYLLSASDKDSMSVLLLNIFEDEIESSEILLNRVYRELECIGCTGRIEGDKVILSELSPYGIAAFEVKGRIG